MTREMLKYPTSSPAKPADPTAKCRCCEYQDPESQKAKDCHCKKAQKAWSWNDQMREAGRQLARHKEQQVIDKVFKDNQ